MQCVIGGILAAGSLYMPESPRYVSLHTLIKSATDVFIRWLIDTDKDEEGMRVIADLHGGDPSNFKAKAEFQEIKDRVMFDVSCLSLSFWFASDVTISASQARRDHTSRCGRSIRSASCSLWLLKALLS